MTPRTPGGHPDLPRRRPHQRLRRRRADLRPPHLADQNRLRHPLHPRRHPPRPAPLRLHRLGGCHHRPRHPPAQLLALRSRHPAHRGQPRRPPHPRPPRPRPRLPRPHQHRPGHHRHHPRQRLTTTTRPPPRQPGHHQAPPAPPAGPSPSPVMPTKRDADMPTKRVAEHLLPPKVRQSRKLDRPDRPDRPGGPAQVSAAPGERATRQNSWPSGSAMTATVPSG